MKLAPTGVLRAVTADVYVRQLSPFPFLALTDGAYLQLLPPKRPVNEDEPEAETDPQASDDILGDFRQSSRLDPTLNSVNSPLGFARAPGQRLTFSSPLAGTLHAVSDSVTPPLWCYIVLSCTAGLSADGCSYSCVPQCVDERTCWCVCCRLLIVIPFTCFDACRIASHCTSPAARAAAAPEHHRCCISGQRRASVVAELLDSRWTILQCRAGRTEVSCSERLHCGRSGSA